MNTPDDENSAWDHLKFLFIWTWLGRLMQRTNSFEKTLMLGKIEGRRRRG